MGWFAVVLLAGADPARAADQLLVTTNYYVVTGATLRAVIASKAQARPGTTNTAFDALTHWEIRWKYAIDRQGEQPRVTSFESKITAVITLPRWTPPRDAAPGLAEQWAKYFKALMEHEQGHVSIACEAALEVRRRALALQVSSVRELETAIQRVSKEVVDQYRQREKDYDLKTGHGVSQGAILHWWPDNPQRRSGR